MDDFLATVRSTIEEYNMLSSGETVIAAVSGGADSVALLYVLFALRDEFKLDIIVAHLNHGIRGEDAERDEQFVRQLSSRLGLASVIKRVDVPRVRRRLKLGLEEAARHVRYQFLEQIADAAPARRIAVAHTADDQVETVLLNIVRGTGPDGLAGMQPVRGKIIRPLIEVFRADVEAYLREMGAEWRTDVTNLELEYSRNRVRHQLIPLLQESFNPNVKDAVLSLSRIVTDEVEVLREATADAYKDAVIEADGYPSDSGPGWISRAIAPQSVRLDVVKLRQHRPAIQRRCVRMAIEEVKGDLRDVEFGQVERIIEKLNRGEEFHLTLPSGKVYAKLEGGELSIFRLAVIRRIDVLREVAVPGRAVVDELGVALETRLVPPETRPEKSSQAVMDISKVVGKLMVRTWKPGDRIKPLGMTGEKKLQDIFTDRKIPRAERVLIPVLADEEKIVWVAGLVLSDEVKVTEETRSALWVECVTQQHQSL